MSLALSKAVEQGSIKVFPARDFVAATSVGVVEGEPLLDLNYPEDSSAEVDMNVVKTGNGRFVELQGTAESEPFDQDRLSELLKVAQKGIDGIVQHQSEVLGPLSFRPSTAESWTLLLATRNPGKVREQGAALAVCGVEVVRIGTIGPTSPHPKNQVLRL